jgi:hypothetical protein
VVEGQPCLAMPPISFFLQGLNDMARHSLLEHQGEFLQKKSTKKPGFVGLQSQFSLSHIQLSLDIPKNRIDFRKSLSKNRYIFYFFGK